jgi:hypothetical protein
MLTVKPILLSAALLAATAVAAHAQYAAYPPPPYQPYAYPAYPYPPTYYQTAPAPAPPPAASYDPYTSGLGPCPQRYPGDPPCSVTMHPTYGQPDFWSR